MGRKRVERLMGLASLSAITRRKGTYRRNRRSVGHVAADLVQRRFSLRCPDRLGLSDVTQHPTDGGTVYLAVRWRTELGTPRNHHSPVDSHEPINPGEAEIGEGPLLLPTRSELSDESGPP